MVVVVAGVGVEVSHHMSHGWLTATTALENNKEEILKKNTGDREEEHLPCLQEEWAHPGPKKHSWDSSEGK